MRRSFLLLPFVFSLAISAAAGVQDSHQQPPPPPAAQTEQERLEEEHIRSRIENGESHASGGRPELGPVVLSNPTSAVVALRVGLHATTFNAFGGVETEFSSLHHTFVELTNTDGDVKVIDRSNEKEICVMTPASLVRVEHDGTGFLVSLDGVVLGTFEGPVFFRPTSPSNLFRVEHIRRVFSGTTHRPFYRGAMEVGRGSTTASLPPPVRVNLFNIVEVEDYVPGVVANESIATFVVEALKAQAVAARGYAIANIGNYIARGYPFDIVDSAASQVYRGVVSEHVNAVQAASETLGLVASANGQIISAMYSSSFGGHSEDSEWISFALNRTDGGSPITYLRGIYDGVEPAPDLSSEAGIDAFWRFNPPASLIYDECTWTGVGSSSVGNTFSRWRFNLPAATIKARMTDNNSVRISPTGSRAGEVTEVVITERGAGSKRAVVARVTFTTGVYEIRGWQGLRQVIGRTASPSGAPRACGTSLLPSNFVLNNPSLIDQTMKADGTLDYVTVYGGGWGHNLGMSQWGAHGRGKFGQSFIEILKAYYTGVDIGSHPIDIGRDAGTGPPTMRQQFVVPNGRGTLEIRATDLKGLRVHINELYDLSFDEAALAAGVVRVDISDYLVAGVNVVHYNVVGRSGTATVTVIVD
jgi:peptidoglycan hydrolase-like amidase